jgi:hypothetical protein
LFSRTLFLKGGKVEFSPFLDVFFSKIGKAEDIVTVMNESRERNEGFIKSVIEF